MHQNTELQAVTKIFEGSFFCVVDRVTEAIWISVTFTDEIGSMKCYQPTTDTCGLSNKRVAITLGLHQMHNRFRDVLCHEQTQSDITADTKANYVWDVHLTELVCDCSSKSLSSSVQALQYDLSSVDKQKILDSSPE